MRRHYRKYMTNAASGNLDYDFMSLNYITNEITRSSFIMQYYRGVDDTASINKSPVVRMFHDAHHSPLITGFEASSRLLFFCFSTPKILARNLIICSSPIVAPAGAALLVAEAHHTSSGNAVTKCGEIGSRERHNIYQAPALIDEISWL